MTDLVAARLQMAISLAFHIIFASIGIALPLMMTIAEFQWLRTQKEVYRNLAKRWARGTAILFAIGAVSGTVLSFELGLLWPTFMEWAGALIGPLFALEGFAFFTEAIFLGVYLHGWDRVPPYAHLGAGMIVVLSGIVSAIFVVIANAWMNTPSGFNILNGKPVHVNSIAVMTNPHALPEVLHMILAAFAATGFIVAGIHAFLLLRDRRNPFHQHGLAIALIVGGIPAFLQPISGDFMARAVAKHQPVKLAAFEALFHTQAGAPLHLGGIPDIKNMTNRYGIAVPHGLSLLLYLDAGATVTGLDSVAREFWPPVAIVHTAFQLMVASGFAMTAVSIWAAAVWFRRRSFVSSTWLLRTIVAVSPLGFLAIESGWVATESGRQPWIIYGIMRASDASTPMPGLIIPLVMFTMLYLFLAVTVIWLLIRHIQEIRG